MNTMKWLIRRELWEHKGSLLWTPAAVATAIAAMAALAAFAGRQITFTGDIVVEGGPLDHMVDVISRTYIASAVPLFLMLSMLVFFYCLGALHDDRRDRSILFWKSLPVSDLETVLSKVAVALVVAPLITTAIALLLSLFVLLVICLIISMHGTPILGPVLLSPELYRTALTLPALLPVYALWALPTVGWLLLVSSLARSKVFLWAVGTPVVAGMLLVWAEKIFHIELNAASFVFHVAYRILLGAIPGCWFLFTLDGTHTHMLRPDGDSFQVGGILEASWQTLGSASVWIGVAAGIAMLAGAVWIRRHREEG
jgi:ABC-2 type transport system permease protein